MMMKSFLNTTFFRSHRVTTTCDELRVFPIKNNKKLGKEIMGEWHSSAAAAAALKKLDHFLQR
jgi:hypothetical protein